MHAFSAFFFFYVIQPNVLTLRKTAEPQGLVLSPLMDTVDHRRLESCWVSVTSANGTQRGSRSP